MAVTFSGLGVIPCRLTTCPKYFNSGLQNSHFSGCSTKPHCRSLWNTVLRLDKCSGNVLPSTIISSRYAKAMDSNSGPITLSSNRWKVAGAECSPNGITLNWYNPLPGTVKAVIGRLSSSRGICQYPCFKVPGVISLLHGFVDVSGLAI
ncbi:hypothetical protein RI129_008805 [Pyrocoelia pectoralis]|uniref:Uncharacterized protein n=1 Tax=Pyrocoelia pectoralis TaxID=417401 RepID=A0AAN7ZKG1_9COLE